MTSYHITKYEGQTQTDKLECPRLFFVLLIGAPCLAINTASFILDLGHSQHRGNCFLDSSAESREKKT